MKVVSLSATWDAGGSLQLSPSNVNSNVQLKVTSQYFLAFLNTYHMAVFLELVIQ